MKKKQKLRIVYFLKIVITVIILFIIFRKINFSEVVTNFGKLNFQIIILLFITALIKIYLGYKNWGNYLELNPEYESDKTETFRSLMIGYALRFLIPGGYGIVGKVYFVKNKKRSTLVSIGIEKFIQIWTALLFASFAAVFYFQQLSIYLKLSLFVLILFSPLLISLVSRIMKKKAKPYLGNYNRFLFAISLRQNLFMLFTLLQFYLILNFFGTIDLFTILITVPLILTANLIPISYAGLGFKETFAIGILSRYNISPEIAVTCTLVIFFLNTAAPALLGIYYLIRTRN
ncbi:MAG: hypothetical protein APR54_05400 [Candidatus Cloacimonas sp. SDB]|nr:MAG: hypothetical protein APR54_05400 [Candidatus Cloacimonas sp. SDB]